MREHTQKFTYLSAVSASERLSMDARCNAAARGIVDVLRNALGFTNKEQRRSAFVV